MKTRIFVCFAVIHVWSFGNAIFVKEALLRHILDELATLKNAVLEQQPYEHQKDSERESSREKVNLTLDYFNGNEQGVFQIILSTLTFLCIYIFDDGRITRLICFLSILQTSFNYLYVQRKWKIIFLILSEHNTMP